MEDGINMNRRNFLRSMVGLGAVSVFPKEAFAVSGIPLCPSPEIKKKTEHIASVYMNITSPESIERWRVSCTYEVYKGKAKFIECTSTLENYEEVAAQYCKTCFVKMDAGCKCGKNRTCPKCKTNLVNIPCDCSPPRNSKCFEMGSVSGILNIHG